MLNVVLVSPEIPANTGNIARTCAVTGSRLHLVGPLGFSLEDKYLKRAGLDYWSTLDIHVHPDLGGFLQTQRPVRCVFLSTKGKKSIYNARFEDGDYLFFGRETAGLPSELLDGNEENTFRIPMIRSQRSLNLSNSVAIVLYEALRCLGFPEMT